jgi:hypothetical protein
LEVLILLILCLLILLTQLPALARSRDAGDRAVCANNLRRLAAALLTHAAENDDTFPGRDSRNPWPRFLLPYYQQTNILHCPSDSPNSADFGMGTTNYFGPRSYIFNGWTDYFFTRDFLQRLPFPVSAIKRPNDTILFGEKQTYSGHWWFDYNQGDDLTQLEQARHFNESNSQTQFGGSNHAFADGSVRFLKFGQGLTPVNLWFVIEEFRNAYQPF